jgi:hypothetical protein
MYQRKTADEYQIQGRYCHGWEVVTIESTWKDAKCQLKTYRENTPELYRIVKKRVNLEMNEGGTK